MGTIRASGIVSGLDVNSIIEELTTTAKKPITQLENQVYLKNLTKTLYKDIESQMNTMKSAIFNLKLESTFNSKKSTSSDYSVFNSTVTAEAKAGSHTVEVMQTAQKASMSSRFTRVAMDIKGAGLSKLNTTMPSIYDQLEGTHYTSVYTDSGRSFATTVFTAHDKSTYTKFTSNTAMDSTFVDANGQLLQAFNGNMNFSVIVNGEEHLYTIPVDTATSGITDINHLMNHLESSLNTAINDSLGTGDLVQYVAVRADYNATTGEWYSSIYNVSTEALSFKFDAGAGDLGELLSVGSAFNKTTTNQIVKYHAADSMADLQTQLESNTSGVIAGISLGFTTLTTGVFQLVQDASMNVKNSNKTALVSGVAGSGIDPAKKLSELAGAFGVSSMNSLLGIITINDQQISIDDLDITLNEFMAKINGAGAGVTMSFDENAQMFLLQSNNYGATTISIGADTDSSAFRSIFGFTTNAGMTTYTGTDKGSLTTSNIINATTSGLTFPMTGGIFTINGVPLYVNPSKDTFDDLINKINNSGAGVTVRYDSAQDKFFFQSDTAQRVTFGGANDTSDALVSMGVLPALKDENDVNYVFTLGAAGQNAVVKIDGQTYTRDSNTIDDVIKGVSFDILSTGVSVLNISVDIDKAIDALASFIKSYNTLLQALNPGEIDKDDRNNKMDALTEADKESMSDDEIAKYMKEYDALHTQDMILKSRELKDLARSLRSFATGCAVNTESTFKSLMALGITVWGSDTSDITKTKYGYLLTDSTDLDEIKTLITDNTTLMDNLANKPDEVTKFFTQTREVIDESSRAAATDANGNVDKSKLKTITYSGWAKTYDTMLTNFLALDGAIGVKTRVDSAIEKDITRLNKTIDSRQKAAEAYLERLYREFTYMETRIAEINSQSQYLSQLSGTSSS